MGPAETERAREETIRATFERFVSPRVVERLLADPCGLCLGGAQQAITVLFADLRGYTALAEQVRPDRLIDILNGHLTVAARAVLAYEGTISQYNGDQIMALYNAPLLQPDHALRAARTAHTLIKTLSDHHAGLPAEWRMEVGVGIATGEAVVGNIGAQECLNYTAIGDTVNLAEQLQELAQGGEVLLSAGTMRALDGLVHTKGLGLRRIRGRSEPVPVYTLRDRENGDTETR
jgi:adenylate cyclase